MTASPTIHWPTPTNSALNTPKLQQYAPSYYGHMQLLASPRAARWPACTILHHCGTRIKDCYLVDSDPTFFLLPYEIITFPPLTAIFLLQVRYDWSFTPFLSGNPFVNTLFPIINQDATT
jgi:hypothetical protein